MSPAPFARRIDQLRHLRARIDAEIAEEERRLARIEAARRGSFPGQASRPLVPGPRPEPSVVRRWAREQGLPVADRGVIRAEVYRAYADAHPSALPA